jgi:hypothetical protein
MIEEDRLINLLRSAMPPSRDSEPSRDLWPLILSRGRIPASWSWVDINIGIIVIIVLLLFPNLFWLLAYHL